MGGAVGHPMASSALGIGMAAGLPGPNMGMASGMALPAPSVVQPHGAFPHNSFNCHMSALTISGYLLM
jgi:hypothetical protein